MSKRLEMLKEYQKGVRSMDPERAMRVAAPGFIFVDGALEEPITQVNFSNYLLGWKERMKAIGGTGRYEVSDELEMDLPDHLLRWGWWKFIGTPIEGSALVKVTDKGVLYEKIAYYRMPPG